MTTATAPQMKHGTIMATVLADVQEYLKNNPNQTIEQIAAGCGHTVSRVKYTLYSNQDKFDKHGRGGVYYPHTWTVK